MPRLLLDRPLTPLFPPPVAPAAGSALPAVGPGAPPAATAAAYRAGGGGNWWLARGVVGVAVGKTGGHGRSGCGDARGESAGRARGMRSLRSVGLGMMVNQSASVPALDQSIQARICTYLNRPLRPASAWAAAAMSAPGQRPRSYFRRPAAHARQGSRFGGGPFMCEFGGIRNRSIQVEWLTSAHCAPIRSTDRYARPWWLDRMVSRKPLLCPRYVTPPQCRHRRSAIELSVG